MIDGIVLHNNTILLFYQQDDFDDVLVHCSSFYIGGFPGRLRLHSGGKDLNYLCGLIHNFTF